MKIILFVPLILFQILLLYIAIRNHQFGNMLNKILQKIREEEAWEYLPETTELVNQYDEILWQVWKPVKSFFPEKLLKFLENET